MVDMELCLGAEIDRIIRSPYPTQLKSLRDILYDGCTRHAIDTYLQSRICQLDCLAECLLEGLKTWPYVLEVITSLSYNIEFRDALLRCEPILLPDLLGQATCDGGLNRKYSEPAVALLSHPLPKDYSLPASAQTLFLRLVQYATQHPCASALKPVYTLLRGSSMLLVGLLSNELLSRLEEQLSDVLRSNYARSAPEAGDQLRTLHCLAIMQMIVEAYSERHTASASFYETQDLLASTQADTPAWTPENMQNFFISTTKAPKTVQLVVLQSMWACQAHEESFDNRMTTSSLSNHIMAAIPSDIRDAWCGSNAAVVQKLQQKVLACQNGQLRLAAISFVCSLCKPVMLQSSLVESVRHASTNLRLLDRLDSLGREDVLACFLPLLDRQTIEALFRRVLDVLVEADDATSHASFRTCQTVVCALSRLSLESSIVEDAVSYLLLHGSMGSKLEGLLARLTGSASAQLLEQSARTCARSLGVARNQACRDYVGSLLNWSIQVMTDEYQDIRAVMKSPVSIHALSAQGSIQCHHPRESATRLTSPLEVAGIDDSQEGYNDWRQALKTYGATCAQKTTQDITKLFARACSDLEARCENVERPLTEEKTARQALQEELDSLQQAYDDLEAQHLDRKVHQDGLEAENDGCRRSLELAQDENAGLLSKISDLQRELEDNQDDFRRRLATMTAANEAAELESATVSAKMQEENEEMQERNVEDQRRLATQDEELDQLRTNNADASASRDNLHTQLDHLQSMLNDKTAALESLQAISEESETHLAQLESDLNTTRQDLQHARAAHDREIETMREVVRQNSEAANASHNHALDRMASQHGGEVAGLEERVAECLQQIKRLEKKCRQKDSRISEANALRVQLLATLGGGGGGGAAHSHLLPSDTQTQTQMSLPHRIRSSTRQTTQQNDSITPLSDSFDGAIDDPDSQIFNNGDPATNRIQTSFASTGDSSSSPTSVHNAGPTPKRARPRRSIHVQTSAVPATTVRTGRAGGNGRFPGRKIGAGVLDSSMRRRPLGGLSVNVSPRKEESGGGDFRTPSKGGGSMRLSMQDLGDSMLDD